MNSLRNFSKARVPSASLAQWDFMDWFFTTNCRNFTVISRFLLHSNGTGLDHVSGANSPLTKDQLEVGLDDGTSNLTSNPSPFWLL